MCFSFLLLNVLIVFSTQLPDAKQRQAQLAQPGLGVQDSPATPSQPAATVAADTSLNAAATIPPTAVDGVENEGSHAADVKSDKPQQVA